jgi:hypothetical protein
MLKIAIPSYKRSDTIGKKTLKVLRDEGFLASDINIFVANEQEAEDYKRNVPKNLYNDLIVGVMTLQAQRKFINTFYSNDINVLQIDDDIRGFKKLRTCYLPDIFSNAFDYCKKNNIPLFGIYPCDNERFMKNQTVEGLFNICGICFGLIDRSIEPILDVKEDWSRSLECYKKYNKLLRLDFIAPKTTYWGGKGGMNIYRTYEMEKDAANKLLEVFPEYVQCVFFKKNGQPDIKLKRFPRIADQELFF